MFDEPTTLKKSLQPFLTVHYPDRDRSLTVLNCASREKVSKILRTWNLGGRQIVSGPIFSDSSYKNRLVANFPALEDEF
jgi:hypothetical protein